MEQREKEDREQQEPAGLSEDDLRDHNIIMNVSRLMGVKDVELDAAQENSSSSFTLSTSGGSYQSPNDLPKERERDVLARRMNEKRQDERGPGMKSKIKATLSAAISHHARARDGKN
eukprot:Plantae.Rhodophyta-Hildenbrandia_rubra.ctg229.p4 GENE.Plantae.Rhodophyta-Hildenbrandia_rubra.ctg229~~Plantae.Rhodophyta-Hildenbrandia_rubra.ctg229.p4  ORF type:complete len:117 (-),score=32.87 Plantae.Rhodophyta-Hildenbrandia_rubra.ctg229:2179-2529(-)